jgi:hypothetical protein
MNWWERRFVEVPLVLSAGEPENAQQHQHTDKGSQGEARLTRDLNPDGYMPCNDTHGHGTEQNLTNVYNDQHSSENTNKSAHPMIFVQPTTSRSDLSFEYCILLYRKKKKSNSQICRDFENKRDGEKGCPRLSCQHRTIWLGEVQSSQFIKIQGEAFVSFWRMNKFFWVSVPVDKCTARNKHRHKQYI